MYQGIFDTDFDKYCEDALCCSGRRASRRPLRPWRAGPRTMRQTCVLVKFFRDHQCPSFLEYSEHPYVSCDEIKKALKLKAAFSTMLDQMQ